MTESPEVAPKANGLQTVLNVIAAPQEAFASLREAPTWGWALIITVVLGVIGGILTLPAINHAMDAGWADTVAASPQLSGMSADGQARALAMGHTVVTFSPIFIVVFYFIATLIQTIVMAIFNAIGRGSGTFKTYWATSWNLLIVPAIGGIVLALIVLLRGVDSFGSQAEVMSAMPSLALIAAHAGKLTNFLAAFTPFSLWWAWLVVQAMITVGRTKSGVAWGTGVVSIIIPALFALIGNGAK